MITVTFHVFIENTTQLFSGKPLTFILIPFLVWPTVRFGARGATAAVQRHAKIGSWEVDLATQAVTWSVEMFRVFGRDPALGPPLFAEGVAGIHPGTGSLSEPILPGRS